MTQISFNPSTIDKYKSLGKPARITISKSLISFSHAAIDKLALKVGDCVTFEAIDNDLYIKNDPSKKGFKSVLVEKTKAMNAYSTGLLTGLYHERLIRKEVDPSKPSKLVSVKFDIDSFHEGMWKLKQV